MKDLVQRVDFFTEWVGLVVAAAERALKPPAQAAAKGGAPEVPSTESLAGDEQKSRIQPRSFWLSAFFFPQGLFIKSDTFDRFQKNDH